MSAPLCLMTSCGWIVLPTDFDIFLPSTSIEEPVGDDLPERRPPAGAEAHEQRALEPPPVLVAALEVDVGRPRELGPDRQHGFVARTESNQTSRMFISRSKLVPPHFGAGQAVGDELLGRPLVPRVGAVLLEDRAALLTSAVVTIASPHFVQSTAGIGTPHARCREMHQSGRFATML